MARHCIPILGARRMLDYTTDEGLDFYSYAEQIGRDTRRIFGQLWVPAPTYDEMITAVYSRVLLDILNQENALFEAMR